ncbi:hypothetical protein E2P81_ATG00329 [Venturia nashicola]|nr:hypothetical protein E2P81_ATG00329 [Venturia nashicola]
MAAQEYFSSFNRPTPLQVHPYPTISDPAQYTLPPYQQYPQPQQQPYDTLPVQQPYAPSQQQWDPRQGYSYPPPPVYDQGYQPNPAASQATLVPPLQPYRSRSEPLESRRVSLDVPRKHHHHHRSRSGSPSRSRSRSRSSRSGHSHHSHRSDNRSGGRLGKTSHARSDRDAFLGAGGGAIIGDTLVPGLGTLGGALLGAMGGNKCAKKRTKSDVGGGDHQRRKYKDGFTVYSKWASDR